jgi:NTE family protein
MQPSVAAVDMPGTSQYAADKYVARSREARDGIALCLSGGGFRAALFHLGALRRLNELEILPQVKTITAVSGGSVIAAHLADTLRPWPNGRVGDWDDRVAAPFRTFVAKNLGTRPILKGWLPWNWANNAGINALARECDHRLKNNLTLHGLPSHPQFMFCATNLVTGGGWVFDRTSDVDYSLGTAAAVSSCYPIYFRPFTLTRPHRVALVDGGVDDNKAVEPVWQTHEILLVSDGGDVLRAEWGKSFTWSLYRSGKVLWNQLEEVRKRWLLANFISHQMEGTYWGIESSPSHYPHPASEPYAGYSTALARDVIAVVRTTYDAFSDVEAAVLENHGYFLAEAATLAHQPRLRRADPPPPKAPHPAWMCERKVREALRDSARALPPRW